MMTTLKNNNFVVMILAVIATVFLVACISVKNASAASSIESLSTGTATACAVVEFKVKCWGSNANGMLGNGSAVASSATPVDVHSDTPTVEWTEVIPESTSCVTIIFEFCTTKPEERITRTSPSVLYGRSIEKVSVGSAHACALADGRVFCWGKNDQGQLGNRSAGNAGVPVAVDTSAPVVKKCVQYTNNGRTCTKYDPAADKPGSALRGKEVIDVSVGDGFTCASATDGSVACWGSNKYGQLGIGNRDNRNYPVAVNTDAALVRTCVQYTNNGRTCTKYNPSVDRPASGLNGKKVVKLATMKGIAATMCAITNDGAAACWGQNYAGQAGVGGTAAANSQGSARATITAGGSTSNGSHCYGSVESRVKNQAIEEAAITTLNDVLVPRSVSTTQKFTEITMTAGEDYAYATANTTGTSPVAQRVFFWGGFTHLGDPSVKCSRSGSHRNVTASVTRYYAGQTVPKGPLYTSDLARQLKNQSIALVSGNAYVGSTWSENKLCVSVKTSSGGIFGGTTTKQVCNVSPDDLTCAVLANNRSSVHCETRAQSCVNNSTGTEEGDAWLKANGQWVETCGLGPVPVPTGGASWLKPGMNVTAIDTGYSDYSCAVANNTIGCWGKNTSGQLGDGSRTDRNAPVKVVGI